MTDRPKNIPARAPDTSSGGCRHAHGLPVSLNVPPVGLIDRFTQSCARCLGAVGPKGRKEPTLRPDGQHGTP